jgi:hypothetical protein
MKKLNIYAKQVTSQWGEDGIIEYIVSKIPSIPRIACEFGAWDGVFLSNTYTLWHDKGWRGILIECEKDKAQQIREKFSSYDLKVLERFVKPSGDDALDRIFEKEALPFDIGVLSIDIDSCDYFVWKGLERVDPAVVIIEHNPTIPGYIEYYDPEDERFLLCSAKALETLGKVKGYKLVCCTLANSIFVKEKFFDARYFPDLPVEALFDYSNCVQPLFCALPQGRGWARQRACYGKPRGGIGALMPVINRLRALFDANYRMPSKKLVEHMARFDIHPL